MEGETNTIKKLPFVQRYLPNITESPGRWDTKLEANIVKPSERRLHTEIILKSVNAVKRKDIDLKKKLV